MDKFTTTVRNFKNPLSITDRTSKQIISNEIENLNNQLLVKRLKP